jgi:plasmid replication initiation protein
MIDLSKLSRKELCELEKNYKFTLTEQQAKELYQLLRTEKDSGCLTPDKELKLVYHELKDLFDTGIR